MSLLVNFGPLVKYQAPDLSPATSGFQISTGFIISLVPYALTCLVLVLLTWRLIDRLKQSKKEDENRLALHHSESGSSAVEFLLIFPLLLMMMLTILQIALIVQAKFVVSYAAFSAARSAIVTIPARVRSSTASEGRNRIDFDNDRSPKLKIITRAAAFPCLAISPRWSSSLLINTGSSIDPRAALPLQMLRLFSFSLQEGSEATGGMVNQMTLRAMYAYDRNNTSVVISSNSIERGRPTDHSPITVRVTHRYYLTVPFANRLLGRAFYGGLGAIFSSARYYPIVEEFTLLNEGEPLYPQSQQQRFRDSDVELEVY